MVTRSRSAFPSSAYRSRQPEEIGLDLGPENGEGVLGDGQDANWEDDSEESNEEEHFTCVPTRWKTGGINCAFEQL